MAANTNSLRVQVAPGAALPNVGHTLPTKSELSGLRYLVRVTSIQGMRWLPNGHIEVTVRGSRTVERKG